jgi:hypothetical protein
MEILESRTLKFTSATEFNDLFEFLPRRKNTAPVSGDEWASSEAWDFVLELSSACPHFVCCFSSEKDNMLMWSHYGDSHKGIAIGFQTKNAVFEDRLYEVTYSRERVAIELKRTVNHDKLKTRTSWQPTEDEYLRLLTTKSDHWRYETEWRLIRNREECRTTTDTKGNTIHVVEFPQSSVSEIILGARCPDRVTDEILPRLSQWKYGIGGSLLRAQPDEERFGVNVS